ncbi:RNA helicase [Enterococcus sp. AZ007]|uniref:RNA helicase n=1 Tax=Enterococcus sp. AZ007 TaxID=2774839 RepID=UPI003F28531A
MDKKLIHAVAGSGKTRSIIDSLDTEKRTAIITYTTANQEELKKRITHKFGYIPDNIHVFGLFQFLYNFCIRPTGLFPSISGFILPTPSKKTNYYAPYTQGKYFLSNMMSKFLLDKKNTAGYLERIRMFFDCVYIDEVQDITSYDFDWILTLVDAGVNLFYFGDFYQKTFSSSRNGKKGSKVQSDYTIWQKEFEKKGFYVDTNTLQSSHRCPESVCNFISSGVGIPINSNKNKKYDVRELVDTSEIDLVMKNNLIKKLFYQKHYSYDCNSQNWGDSKGLEFEDVCVVLNDTTYKKYKSNSLNELANSTKSKFYVACTRTLGNLYFIEEKKIKCYKFPNI